MSEAKPLTHLGLILDGNRRWARAHGLPTLEGHRKGYDNLKDIARAAFENDVSFVSAFIFSTENWNRDKEETNYLMRLALKIAEEDAKELIAQNVKIVVLGQEHRVPGDVLKALRKAEEDSKDKTGGTLVLCFNYGGYQEITDAVKKIIKEDPKAEVTPESISQQLYHPEIPPLDLIIRTSGEQRLSNFMLWRAAYAEFYFTKKHWPDFGVDDLYEALEDYKKRNRRFGGN